MTSSKPQDQRSSARPLKKKRDSQSSFRRRSTISVTNQLSREFSSNTLGAMVENANFEQGGVLLPLQKNRLTVVCLTTFACWFCANLSCWLIITQGFGVKGYQDAEEAATARNSSSFASASTLTDTAPTSGLNPLQFQVYMGFFLWFTILTAGLGLELMTWVTLLQHGGWSDDRQSLWKFAQFIFPLLLATSVGLSLHQNYMAMPMVVAGLWKFGFPETLVYMHTAIYGTYLQDMGIKTSWVQRTVEFMNAAGIIIHHGAASLLICMFLAEAVPPNPHILAAAIIPVMQHWFVMLRYTNKLVYTITALALEFYFEWTFFSEFERLKHFHWVVLQVGFTMLLAHWLYLLAAAIDMFMPASEENPSRSRRDSSGLLPMHNQHNNFKSSLSLFSSRGSMSMQPPTRDKTFPLVTSASSSPSLITSLPSILTSLPRMRYTPEENDDNQSHDDDDDSTSTQDPTNSLHFSSQHHQSDNAILYDFDDKEEEEEDAVFLINGHKGVTYEC